MFRKITTYFREARDEFRRVTWPTRREAIRLSAMVVGFSLVLAAFLGVFDYLFTYLLKTFVL